MHDYIALSFENLSAARKEILIAQLNGIGFEGFEEGSNWLSAFIRKEDFNEAALEPILTDPEIVVSKKIIPHQNWNSEWEKNFEPVQVDDFCIIRASFHKLRENIKHDIIITPKMSFGTGHHATTYMMLQWMRKIDFENKAVLDFGTGTGILSILAEKLGASHITAIDNDDRSIENAAENIAINHCSHIILRKADNVIKGNLYDVILANINKNVLLANMNGIGQHLQVGGVVLLSGLLKGDRESIEREALNNNLKITGETEKGEWIALKLAFTSR